MRKRILGFVLGAVVMGIAAPAVANNWGNLKAEHWGVITRNTIGSPVAALRDGPYGSFGHTGESATPPYGTGSLGLEVMVIPPALPFPGFAEKVDFGNEVDFFGDRVNSINNIGFFVFQTGENVSAGGPSNMPNIRLEIDANLNALPADNYTTMVWLPDPVPASAIDEWSEYQNAATTGQWYFTGAEGAATGCSQATTCTFAAAKTALNDGGQPATILTVQVGKGRDSAWVGAVDGLRINSTVYDFEADGVRERDYRFGPHF
jgi:hypothetical protein